MTDNNRTRYSLSECLDTVIDNRGVTPHKRGTEWCDNGIMVLSANNVKTSGLQKMNDVRFIDESIYDSWMKIPLERGDLILTSEAPAGEIFYWDSDEKIILGQRLYGLKVKKSISSKYLKYYLQSDVGQKTIARQQSGSTVLGISAATFPHIYVELPPREIQDKASNILWTLDSKINSNLQLSKELDSLAKTIYDYWFLQFDFPNEEGKPYRSSGGKMVWSEELMREIPEGWKVTTLKGKYQIERGISYTSEAIQSGVGVPMINLGCIDTERNYREDLKFYSETIPKDCVLAAGDLLIACTDLTRDADIVGCPILVPDDNITYTYSTDLVKLSPTTDEFHKFYLYMTLRTEFYHNYIKKWASGTNVLHLNLDGLDWYQTYIPPKELQEKYAELIDTIHKKNSELRLENHELISIRDFLLPMLISGQIGFE